MADADKKIKTGYSVSVEVVTPYGEEVLTFKSELVASRYGLQIEGLYAMENMLTTLNPGLAELVEDCRKADKGKAS